ncbi:carotenoid ester lipase [Coprinopsis sp. MPI-PUGE-AT-0042]|nr:carotenoid ester lipase [Coprinopsis sp. MPI-PUGE-AT-0042]
MFPRTLAPCFLLPALVAAAPQPEIEARAPPTISVNGGTFVGKAGVGVDSFNGIPFAEPPFNLPKPIGQYSGTYDASKYGPACPQQAISLPLVSGLVQEATDWIIESVFAAVFPDSEDCLTLNIAKPSTATASSKLPVVVWIYGGGFQLGATSMYDGATIVKKSQSQGEPVIFVSMNYRVSAYGFLASKEVRAAGVGNIGLHDQREALRWVQKNIAQFGGDPTKVTLWGESAGAISASLHMVAYNGNHQGLFRAAFMQSGAPIPVGPLEHGQGDYDNIVKRTGCSGAQDTLACLRTVPYAKLKDAVNASPAIFDYQSLRLAWLPREDGVFLTDQPLKLVRDGKIARVPIVNGNCEDEGTLFSIAMINVTTNNQFKQWVKGTFLTTLSDAQVDRIAELYPQDITKGSPFNTGVFNALTPQFKRLAAFQGDGVFQAPRRWFLKYTAGKQPVWSYVSRKFKVLPILGSTHATDLVNSFFLGQEMQEHVIRFTNKLDPNVGGLFRPNWPQWTASGKDLLEYSDGLVSLALAKDNYREKEMEYLVEVTLDNPV